MDEAQMLESTTSKTAEMALRLRSTHRWCVTGKFLALLSISWHFLAFFGTPFYVIKQVCLCTLKDIPKAEKTLTSVTGYNQNKHKGIGKVKMPNLLTEN